MFRVRPVPPRHRHKVSKITRRERRANKELRERLSDDFAEQYVQMVDKLRINSDAAFRRQIVFGSAIGIPEDALSELEANLTTGLTSQFNLAIRGGAAIGLRFSGAVGQIDIDPQRITEAAAEFAQGIGSTRIAGINRETRLAVRQIVSDTIRGDFTPNTAARQIGQKVGLTRQQARSVQAFEQRLIAQRIPTPLADTQNVRETIAQDVEKFRDRQLRRRGRNISETETQVAIQHGESVFWEEAISSGQVDPKLLFKTWFTVQDDRVCPICEPLHGVTIPFNESFSSLGFTGLTPPAHVRCLIEGTEVATRAPIAACSIRRFEGEVIVLRTAAGHELTVTPNHPILTHVGWIAAGRLYEGAHVVSCSPGQWESALIDMKDQHGVTQIEEVANALAQSDEFLTTEVPTTAADFHGDGVDHEVAEILINRHLDADRVSLTDQHLDQSPLVAGYVNGILTSGSAESIAPLLFDSDFPASCGDVRSSRLRLALIRCAESILESLSRAAAAELDTVADQDITAEGARKSESICDRLGRFPLEVQADYLISVERRHYEGNVYNLDAGGWYAAGGIVTHNCRCFVQFTDDPENDADLRSEQAEEAGLGLPAFLIGAAAVIGGAVAIGTRLFGGGDTGSTAQILPFPTRAAPARAPSALPIAARRKTNKRTHWRATPPKGK